MIERLTEASFRGAYFFLDTATTTGGRKDSLKQFVGSDRQLVEDLGLRPRSFSLEGTISARTASTGEVLLTYYQMRDELLAALETAGPGVLVHPFFGTIEQIVPRNYSLVEDLSGAGIARITMAFDVSDSDGRPSPAATTLAQLNAGARKVSEASSTDIAGRWGVTAAFTGTFADGIEKATSIIDSVNAATDPLAVNAAELDSFSALLGEFQTDVASLVANPEALATSVTNVLQGMDALFATAKGTFAAVVRLFPFGDLDLPLAANTPSLRERARNRGILNSAVQSQALALAYLNAGRTDFDTVEDIDEVGEILETQYRKLVASGALASAVEDELNALRRRALDFFEAQRLAKPRIFEIEVRGATSARLLAYRYYGSSALGPTLARLNGAGQSVFLSGPTRILSQ